MTESATDLAACGPVRPTASASVRHRPLGGHSVQLTSGLLHHWQQRNREASLPLALRQLETAGNLDNLRLAVAGERSGYRGPAFMDSDVHKTLEAISWELGRLPDAVLADFAADTTGLLAKAQQPDGYLNSYAQVTGAPRYARLESSHEMYCAGHLIQASVAASRTFDTDGLLAVARKFADHLVSVFLGGPPRLDGHPIIETALVELYRQTAAAEYLELAGQFLDQRGHGSISDSGFGSRYLQDQTPVRSATAIEGHAVRALYLESGVADVAAETGDEALLATSVRRWADMVATKTALTGGNGSRHSGEAFGDAFELPPDRAYNETCAAIASFQWSWRLLLATGDAKYADLMERVLFNGFGAAISADGQRFFYVNPLQRRDDHFEDDDPGRRREWFSCACCPPNIMRLIASLHHYVATTAGDTLYLHQFAPAQVSSPLAGSTISLDVQTGYPWSGSAAITVRSAPAARCGLALRVPSWSRDTTLRLNGEPLPVAADEHGYLTLCRRWQSGDVLTLGVDVRARLSYPGRRADALRGTAAVERGPLVYCFEQADQVGGQSVEDLTVTAPVPDGSSLTERADILSGVGQTVIITTDARHLPPESRTGLPYVPESDSTSGTPAVAVAIPYFQWDNRDGRAMRVWIPVSRPDGVPAPSADAADSHAQPSTPNS